MAYFPGTGPREESPLPQDHFKRGYQERANMRDKEFYSLRTNGTMPHNNNSNASLSREQQQQEHFRNGLQRSNTKSAYLDDHWSMRGDRAGMLQGMDVGALVDRLSTPGSRTNTVFHELDQARKSHRDIFESGKAMTAIISAAARRRNIQLAYSCWDWMDECKLEKNVYHYNSMISVMEKDKDFRSALDLLEEMTRRRIKKNEVT
jgi:pentatricopeptide repeat protein